MYLHSYRIFSWLHCPRRTVRGPFTQPQPYYSIDRCVHHPFLPLLSRFVSSCSQSLIYQHAPILSWSTNRFDAASSMTWSISESWGRTGRDKVCNCTSPPDKSNWLSRFNSVQTWRFELNSILFQVPSTEASVSHRAFQRRATSTDHWWLLSLVPVATCPTSALPKFMHPTWTMTMRLLFLLLSTPSRRPCVQPMNGKSTQLPYKVKQQNENASLDAPDADYYRRRSNF